MKKNRVIGVITALLLCFSISIPSQAQSINGKARDRVIMQNGNPIQRIYQGQNVAFVYTHDITFHYDSAHAYTVEVEHGQNAAAYGNTLAATKGINVSSYTPHGAAGAWQLVGWKVGDVAANATGVSNTIASTVNADLYAVWAKDCTSYFNFNGGSCTAWNSFGTDWYARGSAYYNNGNITPFSVKLPTVARANYTLTSITNNGAGSYAAGGTYNLTDKATFICNWQVTDIPEAQRAYTTILTNWGAAQYPYTTATITPANSSICYLRVYMWWSDRTACGHTEYSHIAALSGVSMSCISSQRTGRTGSGTYEVVEVYKCTNYNGSFTIRTIQNGTEAGHHGQTHTWGDTTIQVTYN